MESNDVSAQAVGLTYEEKIEAIAGRFEKSPYLAEITEDINMALWHAYQEHKGEDVERHGSKGMIRFIRKLIVGSWNVMVEPGPTDHY